MKNTLFLLLASILILQGCNGKKQNEVTVYTSVDQVFSEPVLKEFEKQTGIKVKALYDTEETKSTGVLNRLLAEKDNPRCDLFWSGDPVRAIVLKHKNIATPYQSPAAKDIPAIYKDKDGFWTGFSARARVIIYNKKFFDTIQPPASIFDFLKPEYKGKFAIANPLFGTTTFHFAALFTVMGDDSATAFLDSLIANQVVLAASNGDVKNKVINGEVICGLTDTDDAFEAMKENKDIAMVFPDQKGLGTLIMPNTITLIKNSPNPDNARKLADFLLSKETESMLAKLCAQMPLHKGVKTPAGMASLDNIKPMQVDYDLAADKLQTIQPFLKKWAERAAR